MYDHLLVDVRDGVAWVTLNRPDRMNALGPNLIRDLAKYFGSLNAHSKERIVVLQGAGRSFCAGLDLKDADLLRTDRSAAEVFDQQHAIRNIMLAMRKCPQPIISVIQGSASGGGFALALASDIRLATTNARMNAAFIKLGLSGCDVGVSYFLPRMVGSSVAAQYLLTGRFMEAQRGYDLGLISALGSLSEMQKEAADMAAEMLQASPLGLRLTKEALHHAVDTGSLEATIAMEDRNQVLCATSEDFAEGVAAFLEKRPANYTGR